MKRCQRDYALAVETDTLTTSILACALTMAILGSQLSPPFRVFAFLATATILFPLLYRFTYRSVKADEEDHLQDLTIAIGDVLFRRGLWLSLLEDDLGPKLARIPGLSLPRASYSFLDKLDILRRHYPQICDELDLFAFSEEYQRAIEYYGSPLLFQRTKSAFPKFALFKLWKLALARAVTEELGEAEKTSQKKSAPSRGGNGR